MWPFVSFVFRGLYIYGELDIKFSALVSFLTAHRGFIFFSLFQVKLDKSHSGKPSRVIHIRNIPNEVSEAEIIHLGLPFGRVTNVLVLKGKNQVSAFHAIVGQQVYIENHRKSLTDTAGRAKKERAIPFSSDRQAFPSTNV